MCIWRFPLNLTHPHVMSLWCHCPKNGAGKFKAVYWSQYPYILDQQNSILHSPSLNLSVNNSEVSQLRIKTSNYHWIISGQNLQIYGFPLDFPSSNHEKLHFQPVSNRTSTTKRTWSLRHTLDAMGIWHMIFIQIAHQLYIVIIYIYYIHFWISFIKITKRLLGPWRGAIWGWWSSQTRWSMQDISKLKALPRCCSTWWKNLVFHATRKRV